MLLRETNNRLELFPSYNIHYGYKYLTNNETLKMHD